MLPRVEALHSRSFSAPLASVLLYYHAALVTASPVPPARQPASPPAIQPFVLHLHVPRRPESIPSHAYPSAQRALAAAHHLREVISAP
ncbi:hypothetical protein B0J12DRAFT_683081 [Macrophomina phaseolina]|uniref:Secreted protein n=1 Tax=Macrophomina phaseolina TaxID=35725 RepID=A0ABQ8FV53_9PEZI|nr:hypothetical protein B0J12DRAFT_683081 [Macrophomina phaseolina]